MAIGKDVDVVGERVDGGHWVPVVGVVRWESTAGARVNIIFLGRRG